MGSTSKEQHDLPDRKVDPDQRAAIEDTLVSLLKSLPERRRRESSLLQKLSLLLTGGITLAGLVVGFGIWRSGTQFLSTIRTAFLPAQPPAKVDVRSIVVDRVRSASELTTAVFAMQAVVPASRDRTLGGYIIGKTTLLYIAYGEVRAGVNLGNIQPQDVQVSNDTIYLRLPPPQILDSKIDVNRSSVYDYDRGFLGLGPDVAPELQSLAQRETLKEIVETACSKGVLQDANERAKLVVGQLLNTAGYANFSVETQAPPPGTCALPQPSGPLPP
ncbi:MAG TPA: DUF4230 domain-containing protein [Crinalium sp.]|jgi:hypothetical protein